MSLLDDLRKMQRKTLLKEVSTSQRLIRQIYIRAAKQLGERAGRAKDGSLTKRWLEDYSRAVNNEIARMNDEIERVIRNGAGRAAQARVEAAAQYLNAAAGVAKPQISDSFSSVLSHCRTDALEALIGGKMYSDGLMLSARIWDATGRLQGGIEEILAQGVAQQHSAYRIARALEAYINPEAACPVDWRTLYPDTPFKTEVDYNAIRLARTAINHVYWQTGINAAKENPFCEAMHWELSNSHYERQIAVWGEDECDVYAAHDEGLGTGNFPKDKVPRPHPNCLCIQYEVLPSPEEAGARMREWMRGGSDPALDQSFGKWMKSADGRRAAEESRLQSGRMIQREIKKLLDNSGEFATMDTDRIAEAMLAEPMIADAKIYQFMLKPGGKHNRDFVDAGYNSEADGERLRQDILERCKSAPVENVHYVSEYGYVNYVQHILLGTSHRFRVAWKIERNADAPQLITCFRKEAE